MMQMVDAPTMQLVGDLVGCNINKPMGAVQVALDAVVAVETGETAVAVDCRINPIHQLVLRLDARRLLLVAPRAL